MFRPLMLGRAGRRQSGAGSPLTRARSLEGTNSNIDSARVYEEGRCGKFTAAMLMYGKLQSTEMLLYSSRDVV